MRINTRTGKLELVKSERQKLVDAAGIIHQIEKHGSGELQDCATAAAAELDSMLVVLNHGEPAVNAEGEPVAAPY